MSATRIESVRIKGFRSLADMELSGLGGATVMIGATPRDVGEVRG